MLAKRKEPPASECHYPNLRHAPYRLEGGPAWYPTGTFGPCEVPATVATGVAPRGIAVSSDGKNVYVTDVGDNIVSQYDIDTLTGALSEMTPATVTTGSGPSDVAVGLAPVTIVATSLPPGIAGQPYSFQLRAVGGTQPYTWDKYLPVESGVLVPRVMLSRSSLISGVPNRAGSFTFTVKCRDSSNSHKNQAVATFTLVISP